MVLHQLQELTAEEDTAIEGVHDLLLKRCLDEDRSQESDRLEEPPDTLGANLSAPQREMTSQYQDECLEAKTRRDGSTLERALPGGPVKMETSPADQDHRLGGLSMILMLPALGP